MQHKMQGDLEGQYFPKEKGSAGPSVGASHPATLLTVITGGIAQLNQANSLLRDLALILLSYYEL